MLPSVLFARAAGLFAESWAEFGKQPQHWSWVPAQHSFAEGLGGGYLCLNNIPVASHSDALGFSRTEPVVLDSQQQHPVHSTLADACCAPDDNILLSETDNIHLYQYHIVYMPSYGVPVLLFNAFRTDGEPLPWHEIVTNLPKQYQVNAMQFNATWTFIAQIDHPHLFVPWYMLHPCQTSELMGLMLKQESATAKLQGNMWSDQALCRYMAAWFTLVGPVFGLQLDSH